MRQTGDLVFATGQGSGKPISVFRLGANPSDPLTLQGTMTINYPGPWLHPHSALGVRETPGLSDSYELYFQLADELNVLPENQIGGAMESFGFPDTYVEYRTGVVVGNTGIQPLAAIQPIPDPQGDLEAEGPNDIAMAPPQFPPALQNGVFMGMHGRYSRGGTNNEENPLVFIDLNDNSYFHFIGNDEPNVGYLPGDADLSGDVDGSDFNICNANKFQNVDAWCSGDFTADGSVDGSDFSIWNSHKFTSVSAAVRSVPEPVWG